MTIGSGDNERRVMFGVEPWAAADGTPVDDERLIPVIGRPHTMMKGPVRRMIDHTVEVSCVDVVPPTHLERADADYNGWEDAELGVQLYRSDTEVY